MKEIKALFLALVLLLCFTACDRGGIAESGSDPVGGGSAVSTEAGESPAPELPEKNCEYRFTDWPASGDVKVLDLAFGQDLWPDYSGYPILTLRVISKRPLNLEDFSLSMPIQTGYTASVEELPLWREPENTAVQMEYAFPYYLYQIYEGTDWKALAELARLAEETEDAP